MGICVIIPYYQREPGLLLRAVESVARQEGDQLIDVVVVDDGSPVSGRSELAAFVESTIRRSRIRHIHILEQPNGGVASARNLGLSATDTDDGIEYIAFLDSDDAFSTDHLQRATDALGHGADFYCADYVRHAQESTGFAASGSGLPDDWQEVLPQVLLGPAESLLSLVACGFPVGTSTVVIRRKILLGLRFDDRYQRSKEDTVFWLDVLARARRVAVSTQREAEYGRGVNIYYSAVGSYAAQRWGTLVALEVLVDEVRYVRHLKRRLPQNRQVLTHASGLLRNYRSDLLPSLLHLMRKDPRGALHILRRYWEADAPDLLRITLRLPWLVVRKIAS